MARERRYKFGGLNIRVHTKHSADEYVRLWRAIHKARNIATRGSMAMMLGEVSRSTDNASDPISGYFYKFLNIDPNEPWFDIQRRQPATEDEQAELNIPDHLKPNFKMIPYVFLPSKHKLYVVSKESKGDAMAPATVMAMLKKLTQRKEIESRFGVVDITVLTDRKAIDDLFRWQVIRVIRMEINRPNPTDYEDEAAIFERMSERNVGKETITLEKAPEAQTIRADDDLRTLASIAADNGKVVVKGRNAQGIPDEASSEKFPMQIPVSYTPFVTTLLNSLVSAVRKFM